MPDGRGRIALSPEIQQLRNLRQQQRRREQNFEKNVTHPMEGRNEKFQIVFQRVVRHANQIAANDTSSLAK